MPREERRNRAFLIVVTGVVALVLLAAWTAILRRDPIEADLTNRAEAALASVGIEADAITFTGRDGRAVVEGPDAGAADLAIRTLEGVRVIDITTIPTTTTTTTTTTTPATTLPPSTTTTTTTTVPIPGAAFTLVSENGAIGLTGNLHPDDAVRLLEGVAASFGAANVTDQIVTDDRVDRPVWATALLDALPSLRLIGSPGVAIEGTVAALSGRVPSEERRTDLLAAFDALGLDLLDGLALAEAPGQEAAAALEQALNAALGNASVLFDSGSSELSAEAAARLDGVARLLIETPGARAEIEGHTDSVGPADGNLLLSQARADAVLTYLVGAGVDPVQLTAIGYGETRPTADNSTPEGRAANRRIAFIVEGST
jgi:OOP family OmpA-OmpF porin